MCGKKFLYKVVEVSMTSSSCSQWDVDLCGSWASCFCNSCHHKTDSVQPLKGKFSYLPLWAPHTQWPTTPQHHKLQVETDPQPCTATKDQKISVIIISLTSACRELSLFVCMCVCPLYITSSYFIDANLILKISHILESFHPFPSRCLFTYFLCLFVSSCLTFFMCV